MSPAKRGLRQARSVRPTERRIEDDAGYDYSEGGPPSKTAPDFIPFRPALVNEGPDRMETENRALLSTPQAGAPSNALFGTADLSRPVTRSARKGYFDSILVESPSSRSEAQHRLRLATSRNDALATTTSYLEAAQDIYYNPIEEDSEENHEQDIEGVEDSYVAADPQNGESEIAHPTVSNLYIRRRSERIRAKKRGTREPSPSAALAVASSSTNRIRKRARKSSTKKSSIFGPLRRSARLAKPLDVFHKYPQLPPELRFMVWEAAVHPRLTYICNRLSTLGHANNFGIQNRFPSWFMACQLSAFIARKCYQKLFAQDGMAINPSIGIPLRSQAINPFVDIVVFEPCHNGCRAYYCAQQYRREDRAAVQKLAVQIDSQHLPDGSEPGWVTISRSWPNVSTLFMMKPAVRGLNQSDKAMIRIKEGDHELALRKHFEAWKKESGQNQRLTTLEFVRVVEQEPGTKRIQDRYQSVVDRRTGLVEDIVLG